MKNPKSSHSSDEPLPYSLLDLLRFQATVIACTAVMTSAVALGRGDPEVFEIAAGLVLVLAVIFFSVTLVVGGLGLVPALWRRMCHRLSRSRKGDPASGGSLRDEWLDGP